MAEFKPAEVCATTIAVTCLAGVFIILRFVARYMTVRTNWATDDWLIVVAIVCSARLSALQRVLIRIGPDAMQHDCQPHEYGPWLLRSPVADPVAVIDAGLGRNMTEISTEEMVRLFKVSPSVVLVFVNC